MKPCKDHLGNTYKSLEEMCQQYSIKYTTYLYRIKSGMDKEKALNFPVRKKKKRKTDKIMRTDHLGIEYKTIKEMCAKYNISPSTYMYRMNNGYTIKEALVKDVKNRSKGFKCTDHLGNKFNSKKAMCEYHKVSYGLFSSRILRGWNLENALTIIPIKPNIVNAIKSYDHEGNEFKSIKDMCKWYNITTDKYRRRISRGWTLEKALTT